MDLPVSPISVLRHSEGILYVPLPLDCPDLYLLPRKKTGNFFCYF